MQKKAAKAGFDWPNIPGAADKLSEELSELQTAAAQDGGNVEEDIGRSALSVGYFTFV